MATYYIHVNCVDIEICQFFVDNKDDNATTMPKLVTLLLAHTHVRMG